MTAWYSAFFSPLCISSVVQYALDSSRNCRSLTLQGLKTAKHIGALVYSETSAKTSQRSVNDVMEVAALSSAGTTGTGASASGGSTPSSDAPASGFGRQRSFIRRKRFSGLNEAKTQLRKEAAKSCAVM